MIKKILFIALTISLTYILGTASFAAPETIEPTYMGTAEIMTVTNPDDGITTFKDHTVVSVSGDEGVIVTLYTYDPETKQFILYTQEDGQNSWFVGPLGLFVKRLPLNEGVNYIGVFAELNGFDQFIARRVDRTNETIYDNLKTVIIKSMDDIVKTGNSE